MTAKGDGRRNWFLRFLDWGYRNPIMLALVVLTCLLVGGWGFYAYYGAQFEWLGASRWFVWPFVPDCPLFVYLFALVVLMQAFGWSSNAFTAFVALGNIKYGVWTVFVLFYYFDHFFGPAGDTVLRTAILLLHVGMVPLGIVLWRTLRPLRNFQYTAILVGLLVFDYFDYFFTNAYQVYPIGLPNGGWTGTAPVPLTWQELGLVPWFTLAESFLLFFALRRSFDAREDRPMPLAHERPFRPAAGRVEASESSPAPTPPLK